VSHWHLDKWPNFNLKTFLKSWACWHTPVIPALRRLRQENHDLEASLAHIERARLRARGVTQVVEHLPSKRKALSSNTSTAKEKKERKKNTQYFSPINDQWSDSSGGAIV
jgi:uncharacterized membrane protein